jgi:cell division protein FtsL
MDNIVLKGGKMKRIALLLTITLLTLAIGVVACAKEETELFLEITQPQDGAQVSTSTINVTGKTIPDAVVSVSVDDQLEMADVDPNGDFSVTVTLEEGPNYIEAIASDQQGNEKSASIAVIYIP